MLDWKEIVDVRMADKLRINERDEVVHELADHLDQAFSELVNRGVGEEEAIRRALLQVDDWNDLSRRIQIARMRGVRMNDRVRQVWLPGFLGLVLSVILLAVLELTGFKPRPIIGIDHLAVAIVFVPWLLVLPLVGVTVAYLSRRAGGSRQAILASSLLPVVPWLAAIPVVFLGSLILNDSMANVITRAATSLLGWVVIPGAALLGGGEVMQLLASRRSRNLAEALSEGTTEISLF